MAHRKVAQAFRVRGQDRLARDSLNLNNIQSIKLTRRMRCKSADFIGARSAFVSCHKGGYRAAT
jgi:hypothetical protein